MKSLPDWETSQKNYIFLCFKKEIKIGKINKTCWTI